MGLHRRYEPDRRPGLCSDCTDQRSRVPTHKSSFQQLFLNGRELTYFNSRTYRLANSMGLSWCCRPMRPRAGTPGSFAFSITVLPFTATVAYSPFIVTTIRFQSPGFLSARAFGVAP